MNIRNALQTELLFFDGAMGTMLQSRGLTAGQLPELYNLTHPELVTDIHRAYVTAGADIITSNTFQAHELKLGEHSVEAVVAAGITCAKAAGPRFVALDVGPLGQLMEPMGTVRFEQAYEVFRRQMVAGEAAGADLILIETISDLYEAKAAILAAKENTNLPVFCTMTFQADGRSFVGCDPLTAVLTLQGLGVDALGVNCSMGPDALRPVVETMLAHARVPVLLQANAGLPTICNGHSCYHLSVADYAEQVIAMVNQGVSIIGGCCGTTPEHIQLLKTLFQDKKPVPTNSQTLTACTSGTHTVVLDGKTTVIGERLNPTGKKAMQAALRENNIDYLLGEAIAQTNAGAQVLDLNLGLPELDEPALFSAVVRQVQAITQAPLQIDSTNAAAIEAGVRIYNGLPIINSVNGKQAVMDAIFPIAKKYGALVIGLTLDESGIPATAEERLAIARRIRTCARSHGIPDENLIIDCLVLTVSAQQPLVKETLAAIRLVKAQLGLKTTLGVSNVSFGLPNRELLNASFLAAALGASLDSAIINPYSKRTQEVLDSFRVLNNEDTDAAVYIARYGQDAPPPATLVQSDLTLTQIIERGLKDQSAAKVEQLLQTSPALDIIDHHFIPALNAVGARFETGELFLPQLMLSAQAVQNGFAVLSRHSQTSGEARSSKGRILLATVYGDIHDIGKNIVKMLLENYGYEVIDLGKDVPIDLVVSTIREKDVRLVGLSALMTTTVNSMKDTIAAVRAADLPCTFFVGGAVLTEEYAAYVGAEHYAADAMESVAIAKAFFA